MLAERHAVVAVELPPSLRAHVEQGIDKLPTIHAVVYRARPWERGELDPRRLARRRRRGRRPGRVVRADRSVRRHRRGAPHRPRRADRRPLHRRRGRGLRGSQARHAGRGGDRRTRTGPLVPRRARGAGTHPPGHRRGPATRASHGRRAAGHLARGRRPRPGALHLRSRALAPGPRAAAERPRRASRRRRPRRRGDRARAGASRIAVPRARRDPAVDVALGARTRRFRQRGVPRRRLRRAHPRDGARGPGRASLAIARPSDDVGAGESGRVRAQDDICVRAGCYPTSTRWSSRRRGRSATTSPWRCWRRRAPIRPIACSTARRCRHPRWRRRWGSRWTTRNPRSRRRRPSGCRISSRKTIPFLVRRRGRWTGDHRCGGSHRRGGVADDAAHARRPPRDEEGEARRAAAGRGPPAVEDRVEPAHELLVAAGGTSSSRTSAATCRTAPSPWPGWSGHASRSSPRR